MSQQVPSGEERKIAFLGGVSIDGAPISFIVVLAAVTTALAFIPFSVVLSAGGSFPLSQGVFALFGWVLGPIAGAIATGIGTLLGVFLAPHTAGLPAISIYGALVCSFAAGAMVLGGKRSKWWIGVWTLTLISWIGTCLKAVIGNGVPVWVILVGTSPDIIALLLYALPTRKWVIQMIQTKNIGKVAIGLFVGTWMVSALMMACEEFPSYLMLNWPQEVWIPFLPLVYFEYTTRALTGTVIGTGVIAGLRAIGLVKPEHALY